MSEVFVEGVIRHVKCCQWSKMNRWSIGLSKIQFFGDLDRHRLVSDGQKRAREESMETASIGISLGVILL